MDDQQEDQQQVRSEQPQRTPEQQQFGELTAQKVALWEQVKHMPNYEFEQTSEWTQIRELDAQLLALDRKIKGGK